MQTTAGYRGHRFLVDTGADLTVVPRRYAEEVGLDWDRLPSLPIIGVTPGRVAARLGSLTIRIGEIELVVRCLFMDQGVNPFILGRADVLDRFVLTVDAGQGKITFTEIV
ncbi:MAG: retropepsin-like aspartic protease [Chloroflexota bacterium]